MSLVCSWERWWNDFPLFLNTFGFRVVFPLPTNAKDLSRPCYLTRSWHKEKRGEFSNVIKYEVNTNSYPEFEIGSLMPNSSRERSLYIPWFLTSCGIWWGVSKTSVRNLSYPMTVTVNGHSSDAYEFIWRVSFLNPTVFQLYVNDLLGNILRSLLNIYVDVTTDDQSLTTDLFLHRALTAQ